MTPFLYKRRPGTAAAKRGRHGSARGAAASRTLPPFPYKRDRARRRPSVAGAAPRGPRLGRAAGGAWPRPRRPAVASADPAASSVLLPLQRSAQRNGSSSSATARKCFGSGRHGGSREPRRGFTCHGGAALDIWRRKQPLRCGRDEEQDNRQPTAFTTLPAPALERSLPFALPPDHPWAASISLSCLHN